MLLLLQCCYQQHLTCIYILCGCCRHLGDDGGPLPQGTARIIQEGEMPLSDEDEDQQQQQQQEGSAEQQQQQKRQLHPDEELEQELAVEEQQRDEEEEEPEARREEDEGTSEIAESEVRGLTLP